jgi:hypothetical protein
MLMRKINEISRSTPPEPWPNSAKERLLSDVETSANDDEEMTSPAFWANSASSVTSQNNTMRGIPSKPDDSNVYENEKISLDIDSPTSPNSPNLWSNSASEPLLSEETPISAGEEHAETQLKDKKSSNSAEYQTPFSHFVVSIEQSTQTPIKANVYVRGSFHIQLDMTGYFSSLPQLRLYAPVLHYR